MPIPRILLTSGFLLGLSFADTKRPAVSEPQDVYGDKENIKKSKKARIEPAAPAADAAAIGSGRLAAQGDKSYRELLAGRITKSDKVIKVEETSSTDETAALEATGGGHGQVKRR